MKVSRRDFLGTAANSAVALLSLRAIESDATGPLPGCGLDCAVIDLHSQCALCESFHGYREALAGEHECLSAAMIGAQRRWRIAIVPGLACADPETLRTLLDLLHAGTHVVLETGAGFVSAPEFASEQRMLREYFDVMVEAVVNPWADGAGGEPLFAQSFGQRSRREPFSQRSIPYVHYVWPREAMVRDFSRLVPVRAQNGQAIGRARGVPVALKKRVGKGTLIFLGSPMGPLLRAGDLEARSWLASVTTL
jgi:hypothetical protein